MHTGSATWRMDRFVLLVALLGVLGAALGGCSGGERMGRYTINVSMSPDLYDEVNGMYPTIDVDLIGATPDMAIDSMQIDSYFSPSANATTRSTWTDQGLVKSFVFSNSSSGAKSLPASDPAWNTWLGAGTTNNAGRGVRDIYVVANMAVSSVLSQGDARMKRIPLSRANWNNGQQIDVEITSAGILLKSAMKGELE